ncbi:hypothetical protein AB833_09490 [Chromatiales bacterium (ex Bugula neritina AB1)]|nr:hypothetical protein AB833_09490 [Chromatiales bacterium (ex Bugula neritina AB1)]
MTDPNTLLIVFLTFLLAGVVKGVIGMGLPTVSLALLTMAINLPSAMALLIAPSLVTNIWQAVVGAYTHTVLKRIWPFLFMAAATVWIGGLMLSRVSDTVLSALLGMLITLYAASTLAGYKIKVNPQQERWAGPVLGILNGVLTGMTGSFVVPGVMFLQSIGLPRDMLIQAMGMLFTVSTIALALVLRQNQMLTPELGMLSIAAVVPAIVGMWFGQRIRQYLSEQLFRKVFLCSLLILGLVVLIGAVN